MAAPRVQRGHAATSDEALREQQHDQSDREGELDEALLCH
jgi:hypothetical protein